MTEKFRSFPRIRSSLFATAFGVILSGCGGGVVAPDALVASPEVGAFLDRLESDCGDHSVGNQPMRYLIDVNSDDVYFVDITSKLFYAKVSKRQYASDINAFYPTNANQQALDCIFSELDKG